MLDDAVLHRRRDQQPDREHGEDKSGASELLRRTRQFFEQLLEDAVKLEAKEDLGAENQKPAFIQRNLQFALKTHTKRTTSI